MYGQSPKVTSKKKRATVIVETPQGFLLTQNKKGLWLLPGGGVERHELPISAAIRELYEETKLEAQQIQFLFEHESRFYMHHVFVVRHYSGLAKASSDAIALHNLQLQDVMHGYFPPALSESNLQILKQYMQQVQKELESLDSSYLRSSTEDTQLYPDKTVHRQIQSDLYANTPASKSQVPDRLSVECAHCKTNNFICTLEGVVQHLSCSNCKTSYEAVFKYGVMRTKFEEAKTRSAQSSPIGWILLAVVVLLALVVIVK